MSRGGLTGPFDQVNTSSLIDGEFIAEVVDVNDPKKAGACKIRIFGPQDKIPTEHLHWAPPLCNQDPNLNGVSNPATMYAKGTHVTVKYIGGVPYISHSIRKNENDKGKRDQKDGGLDVNKPSSNDSEVGGDRRLLEPHFDGSEGKTPKYDDKGATQHARDVAPNEYGDPQSKDPRGHSAGTLKYKGEKSATEFIKKYNPQNVSGAIPSALDMVLNLKKVKGKMNPKMQSSVGPPQLMQALTFIQKIFDPKKKDSGHIAIMKRVEDFINNTPPETEEEVYVNGTTTPDEVDVVTYVVDGGLYV